MPDTQGFSNNQDVRFSEFYYAVDTRLLISQTLRGFLSSLYWATQDGWT